jgi:hypothetical protein
MSAVADALAGSATMPQMTTATIIFTRRISAHVPDGRSGKTAP